MKRLMAILFMAGFAFISACASDGSYYDEGSAAAEMNEEKAAVTEKSETMMEEKQMAREEKVMETEAASKTMHENEMGIAEETASGFNNKVSVCKHGAQVRIISVVYDKSGSNTACEVNYEKDTGVKTLWTAITDVDYCLNKANEFVKRQEGWGWSCSALE